MEVQKALRSAEETRCNLTRQMRSPDFKYTLHYLGKQQFEVDIAIQQARTSLFYNMNMLQACTYELPIQTPLVFAWTWHPLWLKLQAEKAKKAR